MSKVWIEHRFSKKNVPSEIKGEVLTGQAINHRDWRIQGIIGNFRICVINSHDKKSDHRLRKTDLIDMPQSCDAVS